MKQKLFGIRGLVSGLALTLTTIASAQPVRVFGPPEAGHARPPLWINLKPDSTTGTAPPYTPAQVRTAYGFDRLSADGTGQTIAIVDAYDDTQLIQSDLQKFCAQFGLPYTPTTVQIAYPQGVPAQNTGWQEEISLDVEWAHAIAPGATIWLVEAADSSYGNLLGAVDYAVNTLKATVVSMSWGGVDSSSDSSYDSHFTASGVTFVASAGDSGEGAGVEYPAASPYVVAVGGTSLHLDTSGNYSSETAWSSSGGGISAYEAKPSWQIGWFQNAWTSLDRGVPDVAYLADPNTGVYVVYNGSWYEFGGTSVGAPQWSALVALCNQTRSSPLGSSASQAIYSLANAGTETTYGGYAIAPANFHDITSGGNGSDQDDSAYSGYDLVTGVGSPVAAGVVTALAAWTTTPDFALSISPSSATVPSTGGGATYTVTMTALNGFGGTVDLSVGPLPSGVTATLSTATVSSTSPSATLSVTVASGASTGTYTLTVTGTSGSLSHVASATLVVASTPTGMTVSAIKYSTSGPNLDITLTVINNLGNPVANASVSIELYRNGSPYGSATAATGSNGQVGFVARFSPRGTYTTKVLSVTASGLLWDGNYPANSYTK